MSAKLGFTFGARNNRANVFSGYTVFDRKFTLKDSARCVTATDFSNLGIRQTSISVSVAARLSALLYHVVMVVLQGAKEQMSRVDATRIVAFVQYAKCILDGAVCQFVADTVRTAALVATKLDLSVAFAIKRALPFPTFIRAAFVNLLPKTFRDGAIGGGLMAANVLALLTWESCKGHFLTATAFAKDLGRGMILHSIVSLLDLLTPPNDSTRCGGNYLRASIIPQGAQHA